jgi:hypothetical protein
MNDKTSVSIIHFHFLPSFLPSTWQMKKANKRPSEWLKLLCKDWVEADENLELVETVDSKYESYKPYLKGKLSSQLLCRLCIPSESGPSSKDNTNTSSSNNNNNDSSATPTPNNGSNSNSNTSDFLKDVLNIQDDFDKAYITAQVERFCALYDIRGIQQQAEAAASAAASNASANSHTNNASNVNNSAAAAAAAAAVSNRFSLPNNEATAAAAAVLYGDLAVNAALGSVSDVHQQAIAAAASAAATANAGAQQHAHPHSNGVVNVGMGGISNIPPHFLTADATAAAVAAAQQAQASQLAVSVAENGHKAAQNGGRNNHNSSSAPSDASAATNAADGTNPQHQQHQLVFANSRSAQALLTRAQQQAKVAEKALEQERKQNAKREQKRLSRDKKLAKQRDREYLQKQKKAEKMARELAREEKRTRKLFVREQRERFAQEQKEAALRRAADLVASNRVPIEITRAGALRNRGIKNIKLPRQQPQQQTQAPTGVSAGAAKVGGTTSSGTNVNGSLAALVSERTTTSSSAVPRKRQRSAIIVSTASDLDRIVTHSQNLWSKYNAIAKEHNQRVNWITVAKELGIHVKVREKYARMHSRACQRKFDFVQNGHWKIKDHPEIFQEPTAAEQKARMPPPLPPPIENPTVIAVTSVVADRKVAIATGTNGQGAELAGTPGAQLQRQPAKIEDVAESMPVATNTPAQASPAVPETSDPMRTTTVVAAVPPAAGNNSSSQAPQQHHHHLGIPNSVDAAAAAATAAAVVDAAGVGGATIDMHHVVELTAAAATVSAQGGSGNETQTAVARAVGGSSSDGSGNASASETVALNL